MTTLAVIPARGGSKRLRNKNTRLLGGRPLLCWTIDAALQARTLTRIAVSTESQDIADLVAGTYGGAVTVVRRPEELAADDVPASAAVLHAVDWLEWDGDAVAMLLPTSPFRTAAQIDEAVGMAAGTVAATISVTPLQQSRLRGIGLYGLLGTCDAVAVLSNGAIQVLETGMLRSIRTFHSSKVMKQPYYMDPITGLDIDSHMHWAVAEWVVATGRHLTVGHEQREAA